MFLWWRRSRRGERRERRGGGHPAPPPRRGCVGAPSERAREAGPRDPNARDGRVSGRAWGARAEPRTGQRRTTVTSGASPSISFVCSFSVPSASTSAPGTRARGPTGRTRPVSTYDGLPIDAVGFLDHGC